MNKEPNKDEFVASFLICPLTGKIFNIPVIGKNNIVYEQQAYIDTFNPDDAVTTIQNFKSFVHTFLEIYPEFKKNQYTLTDTNKKSHSLNIKRINNIFSSGKYCELKNYELFSLRHIEKDYIDIFAQKADLDTLKYFIDNTIDLSQQINNSHWHFANYICSRCCQNKPDFVQYFLSKGNFMNLLCKDDNWYPLHQILSYTTSESLCIYAINKHVTEGLSLCIESGDGTSLIELIFKKHPKFINHGLTLIDMQSLEFKNLVPRLLDNIERNKNIDDLTKETFRNLLLENL